MQLNESHIRSLFQKFQHLFWLIIILISTVLIYSSSLQFGFTNWDDNYYVTQNPLVHSLSLAHFINWFTHPFLGLYQPLVLTSLALDYTIGGGHAWMFHLTNLLLHLCNVILVYSIIQSLFKKPLITLTATALFAFHPLQVESVAWITERKNLLFALFFLASMKTYLNYLGDPRKKIYRLAILFFIAALCSKASAVVLPFVFMLLEYSRGEKPWKGKLFIRKIPLFGISFIFGVSTLIFHYQHGSLADSSGLSLMSRLLLISKGLATYLFNFIAPVKLSTYNPLPENISTALLIESLLYFLIALGIIIFIRIKKTNKTVIWGLAFFLVNIGLFLMPPGVPVLVSDRYMYLAIIGPAVIVGFGIDLLLLKIRKLKFLIVAALAGWLIFLGYQSFEQSLSWQNSISLWNRVIDVHGEQPFALIQRGSAYRTEGFVHKAMTDYSRSIELNPRFYRAFEYRGYMYALDGDYQKSIADFNAALQQFPSSDFALASLGFNYRMLGRFDQAMKYLNEALLINPSNADALINRGKTFLKLHKLQKACKDFEELKKLQPENKNIDVLVEKNCNK